MAFDYDYTEWWIRTGRAMLQTAVRSAVTQQDIADSCDVSRQTVNNALQGKTIPQRETLAAFYRQLYGGKDPEDESS